MKPEDGVPQVEGNSAGQKKKKNSKSISSRALSVSMKLSMFIPQHKTY